MVGAETRFISPWMCGASKFVSLKDVRNFKEKDIRNKALTEVEKRNQNGEEGRLNCPAGHYLIRIERLDGTFRLGRHYRLERDSGFRLWATKVQQCWYLRSR
ncbi:hypothetical protein V6N11_031999 [Hibiscus sabdariffa]|uniref:Uncharacterized protein n=1 Tax=Hibiscus sabdariffa TaxID=183260 RepID=A0ABR2T027_9ROSI